MSDHRGYAMVVKTVSYGRYHILYLDCGHYATFHTNFPYTKVKCISCLVDAHMDETITSHRQVEENR